MSKKEHYIVATIKPWNIDAYSRYAPDIPGEWYLVTDKDALTLEFVEQVQPRYIFFPHWSWIVPDSILNATECVCFHMTDVPYGRGGSPLQNLIARRHSQTRLTALRMTKELDAGPVYLKKDLSLEGRAEDIFVRSAQLTWDIIREIVEQKPEPVSQGGEVTVFERRTPDMSIFPQDAPTLEALYDHIRMLDAPSYPKAFWDIGPFRLTFDHAELHDGEALTAQVTIQRNGEDL